MFYITGIQIAMKNILIALLVLTFASCSRSAVNKKLTVSDSLVITFNKPNTDSLINIVSTTEKKAIQKLAGFLEGKKAEVSNCGFDGNMVFYSKGEIILLVVFQYKEKDCRQFTFETDNKVIQTFMSNEAKKFLKSLAEGKEWY